MAFDVRAKYRKNHDIASSDNPMLGDMGFSLEKDAERTQYEARKQQQLEKNARLRAIELAKSKASSNAALETNSVSDVNAGDNRTTQTVQPVSSYAAVSGNRMQTQTPVSSYAASNNAIGVNKVNSNSNWASENAEKLNKAKAALNKKAGNEEAITEEQSLDHAKEVISPYMNDSKLTSLLDKYAKLEYYHDMANSSSGNRWFDLYSVANKKEYDSIKNEFQEATNVSDEEFERIAENYKYYANNKAAEEQTKAIDKMSLGSKLAMSPVVVMEDVAGNVQGVLSVKDSETNDPELGRDYNSASFGYKNLGNTIKESVHKDIDEAVDADEHPVLNTVASKAYDVPMMAAESYVSNFMGPAGLASFGSGAYAENMREAENRGLTEGQAQTYASVMGITEIATEKIPFDHLGELIRNGAAKESVKGAIQPWAKAIATQMAEEGLEEGANDIIDIVADRMINGDKSKINQNIQMYMSQDYADKYNNGILLTEKEATAKAYSDEFWTIVDDTVTGALSGGMSAGVAVGVHAGMETHAGRTIAKDSEVNNAVLEDISSDMDAYESQEAYDQAQQTRKDVISASQNRLSGRQARELYRNVVQATDNAAQTRSNIIKAANEDAQIRKEVANQPDTYKAPEKTQAQIVEDIEFASTPYELAKAIEAVKTETDEIKELIAFKRQELVDFGANEKDVDNAITPKKAFEMGQKGEQVTEEQLKAIPERDRQEVLENNNYQLNKTIIRENPTAVIDKESGKAFIPAEVKVDGSEVVVLDEAGNEHKELFNPRITRVESVLSQVSKDFNTGRYTDQSKYNTTVQQAAYAIDMAINSPEAEPMLIGIATQSIFDNASVGSKTWSEYVKGTHGMFTKIDQTAAEKLYNEVREQARKSDSAKQENTKGQRTHNETVSKTLRENLSDEAVALYEALGKKIGYDFVASTNKDARGDINPATRTISIGANNIDEMWAVANHEAIAEYLQAHGNEKDLMAVQDDMLNYLEEKLGSLEYNNLINAYQSAYRTGAKEGSVDEGKSRRAAANEMFNDTVFALMSSEEGTKDFINWVTENNAPAEQKTILQRAKDFFKKIFDYIQNYVHSGSFNAAEKAALEMDAKQARELRKRIFKLMDEAIANANRDVKSTSKTENEIAKSIKIDANGKNYVDIQENIIEGITDDNQIKNYVKEYLNEYYPSLDMMGFDLPVTAKSRNEFTNSEYTKRIQKKLHSLFIDKMRLSANLEEIVSAAEGYSWEKIKHSRKDNIIGFVRGQAQIRVGNNDYIADIILADRKNAGLMFYDIVSMLPTNIKAAVGNTTSQNVRGRSTTTASNNIVTSTNKKTSTTSSRNSISVDTNGRSLSEGQQNYFSDSKVVDEDGNLKVVYHGTMNDFTVFDLSQARDTEDIEAFFFSGDYDESNGYGNVGEYYLNITNPADYDTAYDIFFKHKGEEHAGRLAREELEALGYDGVIAVDEDSPEYTEYLAFYPEQIKRTDNTNPTEDRDVRRSLAGIKAKTSDMVTLTEAEDMLANGKSMNEIFAKTGWFKGADNKWRFEISNLDSDVYKDGTALFANEPDYIRMNELRDRINAPMSDDYDMKNWMQDFEELGKLMDKYKDLAPKNGFRLEDILKNDALFEAYPSLRRIKVVFEDLGEEKINGSWHESENAIYLDSHFLKDFKHSLKRTLFHEIQHAIQDLEGFAGGSNVNYWEFRGGPTYYDADAKQKYNAAVDELEKIENEAPKDFLDKYHQHRMLMAQYGGLTANEEFYELAMNIEEELRNKDEKLFDALDDATFNVDVLQPELLELTPEEAYRATAGEIEAREVSDRMDMSDEERRNNLPKTKDENGRVVFTENFVNPWEPRKSKKVDTEGRTISPAMQQFLSDNASVFYEDGAVKNYYHGTRYAGFTQFDLNRMDDKQSIFLTDSKKVAKTYSGTFEMFEPDREWSFDELDSALSYMTGGDWELEEIDNGYQITKYGDEAGQETVETYESLKQVQDDFIDNYLNKVDLQSGESGGIYNVYVHSTNPLVIDAKGNNWDEIEPKEYYRHYIDVNITKNGDIYSVDAADSRGVYNHFDYKSKDLLEKNFVKLSEDVPNEGLYYEHLYVDQDRNLIPTTTRQYAKYAKENGYDSVVFNNMIDTAIFGNTAESRTPSQVVIVFDSNQVKSVYNENPTSDADIRKSIKVDWDSHNNYEVPARTYDELVGFNGTDEEIEAAEQQDLAVKAYYANIIHSKNFAGLMFEFKDGNRTKQNFLTRSTRKGYDWQYSYGFDNEPHGHNNYKDVNDVVEVYGNVWGDDMTALYQELLDATPREGVKVQVVREGIAENSRNSFKVYGETSPYADSINESKVVAAMIGSINNSLPKTDVFAMPNDELLRIERFITNKYKVNMSEIEEGEIAANISYAFAYMQNNKLDRDYENMMNYLLNIGDEVIKNSNMKDPATEEIYNNTRKILASHKFKLSDAERAEISNAFGGSWKAAFGAINKAGIKLDNKNGQPVDDLFSEIKQEILNTAGIDLTESDKPSEQILALIDTMTALEPTAYLWEGANDMDKALTVVTDIVEQYYSAATEQLEKNVISGTEKGKAKIKSSVDKEKARLRGEWAKYKDKKQKEFDEVVAEKNRIIQQQQNQLRQQDEQMKKWNSDLSAAEKKLQQSKILTEKQMRQTARLQAQQTLQSYKDRQERAKQIENIKKTGIRLIKWLTNPTDAQHVPEFLQKPLGEFLGAIDFLPKNAKADSKSTLTWQQRMNALREVLKQIEDAERNGENTPQAYFAQNVIAKELVSMMDEFLGKETWDEFTQSYIVSKRAASKVSKLDAKDLATLNKIMSALSAGINNMNKTYANEQFKEISKLSRESVKEIDALPARKDMQKLLSKAFDFANFDELEPITYFEGLGSGAKSVFDELRQGFNTKTRHVREADEYISNIKKNLGLSDAEISKWKYESHDFDLLEGKLSMNTNQIMSLYETLKRKQGKPHVAIGGVKVSDFEYGPNLKKKMHHQPKAIHISSSEAQAIINTLTDEQRVFADAMQQYMATECASWGNRVTEKMFGYKKYEEKDYFPLKTDAHTRATTASSDNNVSYYSIKNSSFTKPITPMANNAVVIDDIFDVFTDHVVKMADYDAYVMPIADAMRWFNYSEKTISAVAPDTLNELGQRVDYIGNMQESIDRVYGNAGLSYFKQFIKDINGDYAGKGGKSEFLSAMMSTYKAQAVGANMRVVIQQPTAVVRAADVIETKYLLEAMTSLPKAAEYAKKAQANSEIAYWKAQGYYETYLGQSFKEIITGDTTLKDKINDWSGSLAGKADDLSWGIMYRAAELKVQQTMPQLKIDSAAYTEAVVKIFEDIVDHTQVVDTIFHKSQWMRSQELGHKITSAFMAEPTKTYNMLYRAYRDAKLSGSKPYAMKRLKNVALIFIFEQLLNAFITGGWDALRDDDKENYIKSFLQHFSENAVDNLNPLNLMPIAKEISSALQGYDATSYTTDFIYTAVDTFNAMKKLALGKSTKTVYGNTYQLAKATSQMTGIPIANIMREFKTIYNMTNDFWGGKDLVTTQGAEKKQQKNASKQAFTKAYESNDLATAKSAMQDIYDKSIAAGNDESEAWGAVRDTLKEEYLSQIEKHPEDVATINNRFAQLVSNTKHKVSGTYKNYTVDQAKKNYIDKWYASIE
ncbi:hypothetical protein SAMN02910413_1698 [Pseudobutyrivibrio sp. C4]|uniref:ADP-ribosyltransferase-containing protein n=1 Tax=Pseudobutyrivibrio sp. C4 TaxID=1520803 RepID=UPI0008BD9E15|nr:LPD23 domain-containing protein [Pseudobutyrivibrio sp. C4]SET06236.1 hypothetical protein SAMN02910413_1698 [Pseudobutyrivibrio sp. C4]